MTLLCKNFIHPKDPCIAAANFLSISGLLATARNCDITAPFILNAANIIGTIVVRVEQSSGLWEPIEATLRAYFYITVTPSHCHQKSEIPHYYSVYCLDADEVTNDASEECDLVVSGAYRYGNRYEPQEQAEQILAALLRGQGCGHGNLFVGDKCVGRGLSTDKIGIERICTKIE